MKTEIENAIKILETADKNDTKEYGVLLIGGCKKYTVSFASGAAIPIGIALTAAMKDNPDLKKIIRIALDFYD
jgi:hypothetical protein